MAMKLRKNIAGFTLIELLIAITVAMIIGGAIFIAVQSGFRASSAIDAKVSAQQDVRAAMDLMALEINMTSYNPSNISNNLLWSDLTTTAGQNCSVSVAAPANPLRKGIREATPNSLTIEADINGDGLTGGAGQPNEVIRYVYVTAGADQYLTRCSCCTTSSTGSGGQPFLGDTIASGRPRGVRVLNNTMGLPVFRYFDGFGAQIDTVAQPDRITEIRRIDTTLAVETDAIDPNTGQRRRMIYSTSSLLRNHYDGQGLP